MGLSPFLIFFPINPRGPAPAFLARALGRIHTYLLLRQVRPSMEVLGFAAMGGGSPAWIDVPERSKSAFMELKRRKVHRYVIFKIDDSREEVVVDKIGAPGESYDDFTASLPTDDCRYAVYDLDFVSDDNCRKSKIFFISWSPSDSRIRAKTIYAVSRNQFRHELDGVHFEIQATDPDDMNLEVLRGRANRT
ncbi:actin-depolymerizing factor isoform X1 [Zea mays]|uniref:ADF-H domain-containing protein n=2 Tax=Zea mays TaxID=4577 RepID=A0A804LMD0_MAIZE|nr:actin-depolymerizing factor isoform X1 [Zea mays]